MVCGTGILLENSRNLDDGFWCLDCYADSGRSPCYFCGRETKDEDIFRLDDGTFDGNYCYDCCFGDINNVDLNDTDAVEAWIAKENNKSILFHKKKFEVRSSNWWVLSFHTYLEALECFEKDKDTEAELTITELPRLTTDEWANIFPDREYPARVILKTWTREK
jgi:hypothetical protein